MTTKQNNKLKPIPETTSCKFMLTKYLAEQITYLEGHLKFLKKEIPEYWENANPNDSTSWPYFHALNEVKDEQRYIKKQLQKLRYIQKVIKLFPDDELSLDLAKKYSLACKNQKIWDAKPKKPDSHKVS
jgi:predicted ATP-dependent endonuclease of OLD family